MQRLRSRSLYSVRIQENGQEKKFVFGHFSRRVAGTHCRNIYSGANGKWYRNSWKEFKKLKNIGQKMFCSDYYDVELNKYKIKTER